MTCSHRMARAAILGSLCAFAAAGAAQAKVVESDHTSYYEVVGRDINEVVDQIGRVGPPDQNGQRFQARTDARIDWSFGFQRAATGCEIRSVITKLTVTVTMPRLVSSDSILEERFDRSSARLLVHETGHVRNAEATATKIDAALTAFPASPTCKELRVEANGLAHKLFDQGAAVDVAYDALTDHGRKQERAQTEFAAAPTAVTPPPAAAAVGGAASASGTRSTSSSGLAPSP